MKLDEVRLVAFESSLTTNFYPLTLTRPTFDLAFGTSTLLQRIEEKLGQKFEYLYVRDYIEDVVKNDHRNVRVNEPISEKCLAINPLVKDSPQIWSELERALTQNETTVFHDNTGVVVFALLDELSPEMIAKNWINYRSRKHLLTSQDLTPSVLRYLWDLVAQNSEAIRIGFARTYESRVKNTPSSFEMLGDEFSIAPSAEIQRFVTLDSRSGPVIIDDNSRIESFSYITGPCYIGKNVTVKSARIGGGTSVLQSSRVAGEIDQSIISGYTNKNHEGFIGHSFIGSWVNLGALTTTSDLKNTYGEIKVRVGDKKVNSGSIKVGSFLADMAKTGIGTTITCGKSIGVSSHALGTVQTDIPSFTMYSGSPRSEAVEIYLDSAIETQRRMMKRRGVEISEAYVSMIKSVFRLTRNDRTKGRVSRRKFR